MPTVTVAATSRPARSSRMASGIRRGGTGFVASSAAAGGASATGDSSGKAATGDTPSTSKASPCGRAHGRTVCIGVRTSKPPNVMALASTALSATAPTGVLGGVAGGGAILGAALPGALRRSGVASSSLRVRCRTSGVRGGEPAFRCMPSRTLSSRCSTAAHKLRRRASLSGNCCGRGRRAWGVSVKRVGTSCEFEWAGCTTRSAPHAQLGRPWERPPGQRAVQAPGARPWQHRRRCSRGGPRYSVWEEQRSVHTHGWPLRHARTHLASARLTASLWVVSRLSSMRAAPLSVASSAPGEVKWRPPGVYGPLSRDAERAGTTMFVTSRSSIVGRRHRGRRKEVCRRSGTLPCHQSSQQPHSRWAPRPGCPCPPRGRQRGGTACCRLQGHEGKLPWRGACAPPPCCPGLRST